MKLVKQAAPTRVEDSNRCPCVLAYLYIYFASYLGQDCQAHLLNMPIFAYTIYSHHKMLQYYGKKNVQQSFSQSHSKFGETAIIQCASNALLAVCWARVHKLSLWNMIDLNHVLDLEDNLFKY